MQTGLHAVGWGLQRMAVALVGAAVIAILGYSILVFMIVAGQAAAALGH